MKTDNETDNIISADDIYRGQLMSYRSELQSLHRESQTDYDKTVVTICSGALVATIGFFDKIPSLTPKWGILTAWMCWSLGLVLIILSFAGSVKSSQINIDHLDKYLSKNLKRNFTLRKTKWDNVIKFGNVTSFIFLVIGILTFGASIGWGVLNNTKKENEPATQRNAGAQPATTTTLDTTSQPANTRSNEPNHGRKNDAVPTPSAADER